MRLEPGFQLITEVPVDIVGRRAELVKIMIANVDQLSRSGRQWRLTFGGSGGYSTTVKMVTSDITPSRVAAALCDEAYIKEAYEAAMMDALRVLTTKAEK